jgi:DNA repair exonuclease SbcCD nuclease subunit
MCKWNRQSLSILEILILGYKHYNKIERYNDFLKAFSWILDKGIKEKIDFIIHTGDLFHNSKINPSTLSDVYYILNPISRIKQ